MIKKSKIIGLLILKLAIILFVWKAFFYQVNIEDDGMLSQIGLRVLMGEIPHVDFEDPYSGLLGYLHASSFYLFGIDSDSTRIIHFIIFICFILWVLYSLIKIIEDTELSLFGIAGITLIAVMHYTASMPSWYVCYIATTIALIFAFKKSNLNLANILAIALLSSLSVLMKINGVVIALYSTAALCFLPNKKGQDDQISMSPTDLMILILAIITLLIVMLFEGVTTDQFLYFVLPIISYPVSFGYLYLSQKKKSQILSIQYFYFIFFFIIGILGYLLIVYGFSFQYLNAFYEGVFILPRLRSEFASSGPPNYLISIFAYCLGATLFFWSKIKNRVTGYFLATVFSLLIIFLCGGHSSLERIYCLIGYAPHILGLYLLNRKVSFEVLAFFLISLFSLLFQYPYYNSGYVAYGVSYSIVTLILLIKDKNSLNIYGEKYLLLSFIGVLSFFFVIRLYLYFVNYNLIAIGRDLEFQSNFKHLPYYLEVSDEPVVNLVKSIKDLRLTESELIAFPNCPEVYFYSQISNPTSAIYNTLSKKWNDYGKYQELIKKNNIKAVVVNIRNSEDKQLTSSFFNQMEKIFSSRRVFGNYILFWERRND